ncbi:MAG: hypothetical protein KGL35_11385 [Bradyrhizobium sp.]|nr:hypothetical protein [Bradyrhizobium sp.]
MTILTGWAHTLADRAGVSAVTVRRWQRTNRIPAWARVLLALLRGELDAIDAAFTGWIIRRGELISPEGWCFAPAEIRTIPLMYGQIREWRGRPQGAEASLAAALAKSAVLGARRKAFLASSHVGAPVPGGDRFSCAPGRRDAQRS